MNFLSWKEGSGFVYLPRPAFYFYYTSLSIYVSLDVSDSAGNNVLSGMFDYRNGMVSIRNFVNFMYSRLYLRGVLVSFLDRKGYF
jgi:hypothetical protein